MATALRTIVVSVFAWLMVWMVGSGSAVGAITGRSWLFLILSGLATGASWICYFRALQIGEINRVAPIDKSSTVLTMLLAFLILNEEIHLNMLLGMVLILWGTFLMIQRQASAGPAQSGRGWMAWAVGSAVFASLTAILGKLGIQDVESNLGTAIRTCVVLLMAWLIVLSQGTQREIKDVGRQSWLFLILSGVTTGLSWMFYYRALQEGQASVVAPIDKLSILVTVLFSRLVLKERLTWKSLTGLLLLTAGTLLLLFTF